MNWKRIMNRRINPFLTQFRHAFVSLIIRSDSDRVLMVDVTISRTHNWSQHRAFELLCQVCCVGNTPLREVLQLLQLSDAKDCLHFRHAHIKPQGYLVIACFLTMITQQSYAFSDRRFTGRDHPTLASRHVLGGIEREATCPKTSHRSSVDCGCMRLRSIFNEHERISLCNLL